MSRAERRQRLLVAIRQDLQRVARVAGYPDGVGPPYQAYLQHGRMGAKRLMGMTGGWTLGKTGWGRPRLGWRDTVRAYGLTPAYDHRLVSRQAVVEDLRRVAAQEGHPHRMPSWETYRLEGRYIPSTVARRLAGREDAPWETCAEEAGLEPWRDPVTAERLIEDYRALGEELGYEPGGYGPTYRELDAAVPYSANLYAYHLGSWTALCEGAGYIARDPGPAGRRQRELAEAREG